MKRIMSLVLIAILIVVLPISVFAETKQVKIDTTDVRVAGQNRFGTSYAVCEALNKKVGKFDNIVVANGMNFPDALSGGYLSKVKNAPLLLVNPSEEAKVKSYIGRYMKSGGTVFLLGGTSAVRGEFEASLKAGGFKVERLAGPGRYDTNLAILNEAFDSGQELVVASGKNYPDSLSGSSVGRGMLLVGDILTKDQIKWLESNRINKIYILGGTGAVNSTIESSLKKYATVERVGGKNRWETSYLIAKKFFPKADTVSLVCGTNFPDGLSGAPLAMSYNSPIILIANNNWNYAHQFVVDRKITKDYAIGGTGAISNATVSKIMEQYKTVEVVEVSTEYKNALVKAKSYSDLLNMSKAGLYDQLTSAYGEKFPADAAQYAIDNLDVDYKQNALKKAKSYSDTMHMSKKGLYDQLVSEYGEKFTEAEAQYAIDNLKVDYKTNALEKAKSYQKTLNMSKAAIYDQLISEYGEGFTPEEAQYAIDHLN